jgi:Na+/alanine symporter
MALEAAMQTPKQAVAVVVRAAWVVTALCRRVAQVASALIPQLREHQLGMAVVVVVEKECLIPGEQEQLHMVVAPVE